MAGPKDKSNVNEYRRAEISPDDLPPDYMGLLSLLCWSGPDNFLDPDPEPLRIIFCSQAPLVF